MASWSLVLVFLLSPGWWCPWPPLPRAATAADYPVDKVTLPLATTGRAVRTQATQGSPRACGAWG